MKKLVLLIALFAAIGVQSQNIKYAVMPFDSITPYWINKSIESGIVNPQPRCTINPVDSLCILKMRSIWVPDFATGYNEGQMVNVLKDTIWQNLPEALTGEELTAAEIEYGAYVLSTIQTDMRARYDNGDFTANNYRQFILNSEMQEWILALQLGELNIAQYYIGRATGINALSEDEMDDWKTAIRRQIRVFKGELFE